MGLSISIAITFGLFVMMAYLVEIDKDATPPIPAKNPAIVISDIRDDSLTPPKEWLMPEPKEVEELPELSVVTDTSTNKTIETIIDIELPDGIGTGIGGPTSILGPISQSDGDAVPMFTIEPRYPRIAAQNGQEGWVKVQFDINPDGTVSNARVIAAEPKRVFDREALRAIKKWKFKAKMVEGRAVVQTNKTYVIDFNID